MVYADDIMLLAPSIQALQSLISLGESEQIFCVWLSMQKNLHVCALVLGTKMHVQVLWCVAAQLTG